MNKHRLRWCVSIIGVLLIVYTVWWIYLLVARNMLSKHLILNANCTENVAQSNPFPRMIAVLKDCYQKNVKNGPSPTAVLDIFKRPDCSWSPLSKTEYAQLEIIANHPDTQKSLAQLSHILQAPEPEFLEVDAPIMVSSERIYNTLFAMLGTQLYLETHYGRFVAAQKTLTQLLTFLQIIQYDESCTQITRLNLVNAGLNIFEYVLSNLPADNIQSAHWRII
jgi:hypothetical protein